MPATRDVVLIAILTVIWVAIAVIGLFISIPGFAVLYPPVILMSVYPLLFGKRGVIAAIPSSIIWNIIKGIFPLGFIADMCGVVLVWMLPIYFLLPPEVAEFKKAKHFAMYVAVMVPVSILGVLTVLSVLSVFGIVPQKLIIPVGLITAAASIILEIIVAPPLCRGLIKYLKASGMYYGTWRNERMLVKVQQNSKS